MVVDVVVDDQDRLPPLLATTRTVTYATVVLVVDIIVDNKDRLPPLLVTTRTVSLLFLWFGDKLAPGLYDYDIHCV